MKKILLCLASSTFLFACGGSEDPGDGSLIYTGITSPIGSTSGSIHNDVPAVDYNNAPGIIEHVSFENHQTGEYSENMFNGDFNTSWETINGKAKIVATNGEQ